jgi:tRNA(Ile)-lysidine synthase
MSDPWIDRIERRMKQWCARGLGSTWVVAVSGGGDSVGLLRVLHELAPVVGLRLSVAHLDHGARGEAARADAAFVSDLAASLALPFDLGRWRPIRPRHFESDARRARYAWLVEIAHAHEASIVAVGHTRDDQAETILHRIIRGTGPHGLAGMPRMRRLGPDSGPSVTLVRPLLAVSRSEIRHYLAALGQPFREDPTNADLSRTRARIRHVLLPQLASEYNPNVAGALVRLGALAAASQRAIEAELHKLERAVLITGSPDCLVLQHGCLRSVPHFLRAEVLRRIWRHAGWPEAGMSARRWRWLVALVQKDAHPRTVIGARVTGSTENGFLVLRRLPGHETPAPAALPQESIELDVPESAPVPWAGGRVEATIDPDESCDETIDLDRLTPPLVIRSAVPGDRFKPLGMGGRSTPLADFYRGRHVRRDQRARIPLICDQLGIVWVVGHRIADRVKVTGQTRRRLGLRWVEIT